MLVRISKIFNKKTNSFENNLFELRESEKSLSGKVSISSKKQDGRWLNKTMPFIAFKSKIDLVTETTIRQSNGALFNCEFDLIVDSFIDKKKIRKEGVIVEEDVEVNYFKMVIRKAWMLEDKKIDAKTDIEFDDNLPF